MITNLFNGLNNQSLGKTYQYNKSLDIITNPSTANLNEYTDYSKSFNELLSQKSMPNDMAKSYNSNESNYYAAEYKELKEKISQQSSNNTHISQESVNNGNTKPVRKSDQNVEKIDTRDTKNKNTADEKDEIKDSEHNTDNEFLGVDSEKNELRTKLRANYSADETKISDKESKYGKNDISRLKINDLNVKNLENKSSNNKKNSINQLQFESEQNTDLSINTNQSEDVENLTEEEAQLILNQHNQSKVEKISSQGLDYASLENRNNKLSKENTLSKKLEFNNAELLKNKTESKNQLSKNSKDNKKILDKLVHDTNTQEHEKDETSLKLQTDTNNFDTKFSMSSIQNPHSTRAQAVNQVHQYLRNEATKDIVQQAKFIFQNDNKGEIKILLHPKEYGEIKLNFSLEDNKIIAKVVVGNEIARDAFQKNLENLGKMLNFEGFDVGSFFVSVDSNTSENYSGERKKEEFKLSTDNSLKNIDKDLIRQQYLGLRSEIIDIVA